MLKQRQTTHVKNLTCARSEAETAGRGDDKAEASSTGGAEMEVMYSCTWDKAFVALNALSKATEHEHAGLQLSHYD